MATQEKLLRSLELLKNLLPPNQTDNTKKKEKIQYCHIITEAVTNPTIKIAPNFHMYLGLTMEVLLQLCDDPESDIRMIAEECLNRIIRALNDGNIGKVQIELHKGIKRNGAARSLRAALWRFAHLSHMIRPHKGRAYVSNLFPLLIKVSERSEEQIHETLASSITKIMQVLGCFASDNEIKVLLLAFLKNISNQSAVIRRSAASAVLNICLSCRKPFFFMSYVVGYLLDLIVPVKDSHENGLILGVMGCLRNILPYLKHQNWKQGIKGSFGVRKESNSTTFPLEKLLQIYELCLHYFSNKDHNVINSALETLLILLQNCPCELKTVLLSQNGINKSRISLSTTSSLTRLRSPSLLSVATTNLTTEDLFTESELTETIRSDIEKWIDESKLSVMNVHYVKTPQTSEKSLSMDSKSTSVDVSVGDFDTFDYKVDGYGSSIKTHSVGDHLESDNSSDRSFSYIEDDKQIDSTVLHDVFIGAFLDKDIPLIFCARLIVKSFLLTGQTGGLIADKCVRVSVKSLALSCLSSIVKLYPKMLLLHLDKKARNQQISDLLLYKKHPDPQLRGLIRLLLADFIKAALYESDGNYQQWSVEGGDQFQVAKLIQILIEGLEDESSTCSRHTLQGLSVVLEKIAESPIGAAVSPILATLPFLSVNPYWLVKVSLCELISTLPYVTLHHITKTNNFQRKILHNVLYKLIQEDDIRVRSAAAEAIVNIIPHLYYEEFQIKENTVTSRAIHYKTKFLSNLYDDNTDGSDLNLEHQIGSMPFPFCAIKDNRSCAKIEFSLSKIITDLYNFLLTSTSRHFTSGCIQTLSLLSDRYPTTLYRKSWNCYKIPSDSPSSDVQDVTIDLLNYCIHLLSHSITVYDLNCHFKLLNLTSNLYAGYSFCLLRPIPDVEAVSQTWDILSNKRFSKLSEHYLNHLVKLLNVFHYILDEIVPSQPQSKPMLPNLSPASTLSPIKRRKSDLDKRVTSPHKIQDKEEKSRRDSLKLNAQGSFVNLPHYLKIYEVLRSTYHSFKISLQSESCEIFLALLRQTLKAFSVILEVGSLMEFRGIAEELLSYFRSTFTLEASITVECVQQLLKCLFGSNLAANIAEINHESRNHHDKKKSDSSFGFYYNVSQKPYNDISQCLSALKNINKVECDGDSTIMGYLHRKDVLPPVVPSRSSDKALVNYIRIFEPMVIKSLKQYTITSDVKLQCKVLQLLSQLIQLRVNYCLLDSEQIFIGFVLKQFEYIEEGQIPFTEELIQKIFQFLVQLSCSKQHSKNIISIPKIIQLCDGLMASGQSPLTHCIPALRPIVEDIFLSRNKSIDVKELETTREVVLSMLLKLSEYNQVIDLLVLILNDSKYCSDNSEKWHRWSQQVFGVLLPMLKQNKVALDNAAAFVSFRKLIFALEPSTFNPIDGVLLTLFEEPLCQEFPIEVFSRWLSKVLIALLILSPVKEEELLVKIAELKHDFAPGSIFENVIPTADPLNAINSAGVFHGISSEMIVVRFLFKIFQITSQKLLEIDRNEDCDYLIEQSAMFLMYCIHMFQSGSHCKIANYAIDNLDHTQLEKTSANFSKLAQDCPLLTFLWCNFLTLLNYNSQKFWLVITNLGSPTPSINQEIVKTGSIILFCDYMSEDVVECDVLSWFLSNYVTSIVDLHHEAPVSEFISALHRNSITSKLFLDNVIRHCVSIKDGVFLTKLLECVESSHPSLTGALVKLLLPQLLIARQIVIARSASNLASRKIELLLTMPMEDVNSQLAKDDVLDIIKTLVRLNLVKKHEALASLLNKLCIQYYDLSPLEFDQKRAVNPDYIKKLQVNKQWYLSQIESKCTLDKLDSERTKLLSCLTYDELIGFMSSGNFLKSNLKECIRLGVATVQSNVKPEEVHLLRASIDSLLSQLIGVMDRVPQKRQVFRSDGTELSEEEKMFSEKLTSLFKDDLFWRLLSDIIPSISSYIESLSQIPHSKISENNREMLIEFGVICLDAINHSIICNDFDINFIDSAVNCANLIFRQLLNDSSISNMDISCLCSAVNSLYNLIDYLLIDDESLPIIPKYALKDAVSAGQTCCHQLYTLNSWLFKFKNTVNIPNFIFKPVKSIIVILSRQPLVNSYMLIPCKVWKSGWSPELGGEFGTRVPPLPIEFLQEVDILQEYIHRIILLGWTNRQQFEETWMCLLSVLCNSPSPENDPVENNDIIHTSSLAVQAITSLLLQTLYWPIPGNTNLSKLISVSRNPPLEAHKLSVKKLKSVQNQIVNKHAEANYLPELVNVFCCENLEKFTQNYSYNQVSVKYLLIATKSIEVEETCPVLKMWESRESLLENHGLDVNSCLQFLLDFYTQLIKHQTNSPLRLLHESVRSIVIISDLFTDKSQFTWMLDIFLELSKVHTIENELLHQYLIVGISKSAAVLNPDLETYEYIKKIIVQNLKSSFLPSRISCLHGLLYILEGCKLSNISIGAISEEMQIILPCVVEYVSCHLSTQNSVLRRSQEHTMLVWALAFFLIENIDEVYMETNFITNTLQNSFMVLLQQKISNTLHTALMKGLERLVICKKAVVEKNGKQIVNLALDKLRNENPTVSMQGMQLLLTYMYTDCAEHIEKSGKSPDVQTNPDHLVQTIEKVSAIFEHIKKGYVFEVEILCFVLPDILDDFFSPSDVLTKVIGEFLSPHQTHPKLLSRVVFQVFEKAIGQKQLPLLQDWVVFSLSNFTQSLSINMATWYLTCFFISASSNEYLRLFFPYIQTRVGRYEYEDRKMLCIAGSDFYKNLSSEKQKKAFIENFKLVKDQPDTLFSDLLTSL